MNKFSHQSISDNSNLLKTNKDTVISKTVSFTGLPENHIKLLYESDNLNDFNNFIGFSGNMGKNEIVNNFSISNEIEKILNSDTLQNVKIKELNRLTTYAKNYVNIDSVELLTGISNLLIYNDSKSKEFLTGVNKLHEFSLQNLNESVNFNQLNFDENVDDTVELFENLKDLLTRQNKRWGNAYRLTNTYKGMLSYLDTELQRMMLINDVVTTDTKIHMSIIRNFMNDENNPLYKDINSVKGLCGDIQTLDFDLMLLIHHFIVSNSESLEFISRSSFNEYKKAANMFISNISSSVLKSKILNDKIKVELSSIFTDKDKGLYDENSPLIYTLTNNIEFSKFSDINIGSNISVKAAHDMCLLFNSSSIVFNLRLRPMMKVYVTKTLELIKRVDEAKYKLNRFKYGK